jgi:TPR repeat protein
MTPGEPKDAVPAAVEEYRRAVRDKQSAGSSVGSGGPDVKLFRSSGRAVAEAEFRRADKDGHALGSFHLGLLLKELKELVEAEAALRRAEERAHANGNVALAGRSAMNIGIVLTLRNDNDGAEDAYRRGDGYGHGGSADSLGTLLRFRGDLPGAEAAFGRAVERGDPDAQRHLDELHEKTTPGGAPKTPAAATAGTAGGGCLIAMLGALLATIVSLLSTF